MLCGQDRTAVMFLAFPVILLILKNRIWNGCFPALPVQVYQVCLLEFSEMPLVMAVYRNGPTFNYVGVA